MRYLFLLFVVVPLLELYLLVWLARQTSFMTTVAITLLTGALGSALAKQQGLRAYREWRRSLDAAVAPEIGLVEALLILVGGVLLITPGLLTDSCGLLLLLPPTRRFVAVRIKASITKRIAVGTVVMRSAHGRRPTSGNVIETRGERVDDD